MKDLNIGEDYGTAGDERAAVAVFLKRSLSIAHFGVSISRGFASSTLRGFMRHKI